MSFNIDRFKENLNSFGYIKNNKFEVFVQIPKFLQNKTMKIGGRETSINGIDRLLKFRIDRVNTPGVSLMSIDTNRFGNGPTQKMPFNAQFFDTNFNILLDRNTDLWDFWYNWTNGIFNFNGNEPNGNNPFAGGRIPTYLTEYKDEYVSTMMIVLYDDTGRTVKTINLYEAFPSSIKEIPLSWKDETLINLAITVTYSSFTIVGANVTKFGAAEAQPPATATRVTATIS